MINITKKPLSKADLSQISLTGIRSLLLLGLLLNKPHSLKEIRDKFLDVNLMEPDNSDDMIRIDINTLRSIGCEISRADQKTEGRFVLHKHPFVININSDEISIIRRAFKILKNELNIQQLIEYDNLFRKIALHVADDNIKEELCGLTALKSYNIDLIYELIEDCKEKRTVEVVYANPVKKANENIKVVADNIVIKNEKIYLYSFKNAKEAVTLNVKRIKKIISRENSDNTCENNPTTVKFLLKDFGITGLDKEESIIEATPNGYIIEGRYFNEFLAVQRILSFGSNCTVIEPDDFKQKIIETLEKMRSVYNA